MTSNFSQQFINYFLPFFILFPLFHSPFYVTFCDMAQHQEAGNLDLPFYLHSLLLLFLSSQQLLYIPKLLM